MTGDANPTKVGRPRAVPAEAGELAPREQILDTAAALFAEHGYAGTSTRAIAEGVGIRQASLYYHFAGKDEILLELLETSVRPSLAFVGPLLEHPDPAAALFVLATIDVGTLLATPHNIGTLYLAHEVRQPRFDSFRRQRGALQAAYTTLAAAVTASDQGVDAHFLGACCMQLVEMVITLRRDGEPDVAVARSIGLACLRVLGLSATDVRRGAARGEQLLSTTRPASYA